MGTPPPSRRWRRSAVVLLVAVAVGACGWAAFGRHGPTTDRRPTGGPGAPQPVTVEVVTPRTGGLDRVCVQPGTVEPFEAAEVFAEVSGRIAEQPTDIGRWVQKGDVLARIAVPVLEKQADRDRARVRAADAKVREATAQAAAVEAEATAAEAAVALARALTRAKSAYRGFREKQLSRIKDLAKQQAIEPRVVDEQEDHYLSALEAENEAKGSVNAATARATAARAKTDQARAAVAQAEAERGVAAAELERTEVQVAFAQVRSPHTGVVTRRGFHVGDFVKAGELNGALPLFTVERADVMRVVVQVPDRDVPFVTVGDPAVVEVDALPGVVFRTDEVTKVVVARKAEAEDPATRTMRTEIDIVNPTNRLRRGMYGRATLTLQTGSAEAVRIPSGAVLGRILGKGTVRVVRDGVIRTAPVSLGADNGVEVEVLTGLTPADRVVVRLSGPAEDGTAVTVAGQ